MVVLPENLDLTTVNTYGKIKSITITDVWMAIAEICELHRRSPNILCRDCGYSRAEEVFVISINPDGLSDSEIHRFVDRLQKKLKVDYKLMFNRDSYLLIFPKWSNSEEEEQEYIREDLARYEEQRRRVHGGGGGRDPMFTI